MHEEKTYVFRAIWGEGRDTDDGEGKVIATSDKRPSREEIEAVLPEFRGVIQQVPPKFSAVKIKGKRAYDLAREGADFKIEPKEVDIHHLSIISHVSSPPCAGISSHEVDGGVTPEIPALTASKEPMAPKTRNVGDDVAYTDFVCECGKGTYVRSLARDIALKLGTYAYVGMLERSRLGKCSIDDTISLDLFEEMVHKGGPIGGAHTSDEVDSWLTPMEWMLDDIPAWSVPEGFAQRIKHGNAVRLIPGRYPEHLDELGDGDILQVSCNGRLLALCTIEAMELKPVRVFNW